MFELIKKYYKMGIYSDMDLELFVKSGEITADQGEEIRQTKQG